MQKVWRSVGDVITSENRALKPGETVLRGNETYEIQRGKRDCHSHAENPVPGGLNPWAKDFGWWDQEELPIDDRKCPVIKQDSWRKVFVQNQGT